MAIGNRSSEALYLTALERVLASRFSIYDYKIGAYQECATCIEKDDDEWIVYDAERGVHLREERSELLPEACLMVLKKMTLDPQEIISMNEELLMYVLIEEKRVLPYEPIDRQRKKCNVTKKIPKNPIIGITGQEIDGMRRTALGKNKVRAAASTKNKKNELVAERQAPVVEVAKGKAVKAKTVDGKITKGKAAEPVKASRGHTGVGKRK